MAQQHHSRQVPSQLHLDYYQLEFVLVDSRHNFVIAIVGLLGGGRHALRR